jgi:hypothetical protein
VARLTGGGDRRQTSRAQPPGRVILGTPDRVWALKFSNTARS